MSSVKQRLEALERRFIVAPVVLVMPDGSERTCGNVLGFMRGALQDPAGPAAALIRESIAAKEPGNSKLIELARAILNSPVEAE